ncbi:MAG: beta-ketoacyl synthase N-terminal-like domain-containing protein, partial [Rhizobiaceae bacterium]
MDRKRIVITGLGGLSALGVSADQIWQSMKAGRPGIGEITTTPLHDLKLRIGAEVKVLPERGLDPRRIQTMDRFSLLAVLAALEAVENAGLVIDATNAARVGAIIGAGVSGFTAIEEAYRSVLIDGRSRAPILTVPKVMTGAPAGQVSM